MEKKITIKDSIKYNELKQYKRRFENKEIFDVNFQIFLNGISFPAILKYGLVPSRLRYDRNYKFKIYFDGVVSKAKDIEVIKKLYEKRPSVPLLIAEILFAKEKQEITEHENGDLEYHFTFLQY